jgi:hypothetical protein
VARAIMAARLPRRTPARLTITLTRIGVRNLDADNLANSFKHVQDGIADALGIDDGDPLLTWRYGQRRGKPKEYAVEVALEAAGGEGR